MRHGLILTFRPDVVAERIGDDGLIVQTADRRWTLQAISPVLIAAFEKLGDGGDTEDALVEEVDDAARLLYYLENFRRAGIIRQTVQTADGPLATLIAMGRAEFNNDRAEPDTRYTLDRFTLMRKDGDRAILETPLAPVRMELHDWRASAIVGLLAEGTTIEAIANAIGTLNPETVRDFLSVLLIARMLSNNSPDIPTWEFHDLHFHARSRLGRHDRPYGGTYRFREQWDSPPVVKPCMSDDVIALHKPDLDGLRSDDAPLADVMEQRRSVRSFGDTPLTVEQLGEFLYRVARVKELIPTELGELSTRPYPAGGAIYEMEFYLVVDRCQHLEAGLYHYCPHHHHLSRLPSTPESCDALLTTARNSMIIETNPHILIVLAARFPRFAWKYESMAYAAILKNVGVLYQSMYLVATAMKLAPCALGGGDSDLFARSVGTNYYDETSVGEFALGSLP